MAFGLETDPHAAARAALAAVREQEALEIADALRGERVLGLVGEAEVGKTQTLSQALAGARERVLYLDLAWAASEEHLGFLLARQIAQALAPADQMSTLGSVGPLSPGVEQAHMKLTEILGGGLQEALRAWPSGRYGWAPALEGLEALAEQLDLLLWVDHLEAPRLTFRHPLKVAPLLWSLSELVERSGGVRLLVSGREAARADALGPRAAFHGRGRWLTMRAPAPEVWRQVADRIGVPNETASELAALTAGHARTMLLALATVAEAETEGRRPGAEEVLRGLAAKDDGLANRAIEHARSLHRLGGQVLTQAALGQRPYANAQRGSTTTQDLSKALKRLRLAGLLRHERRWTVVNPLIAMRLRSVTPHEPFAGPR
jgi:hypothetical protein